MIQKNRILIADKMHESIVPLLKELGMRPEYLPDITREEILSTLCDYSGLIIRSKTDVDQALIDASNELFFVARAGAGMDKLDVSYLEKKGIHIINAPEGNRDAVGEHTLGLLLNLMNNISRANREVKSGVWKREANRGYEVNGKTVGIYGYGNAGASFAKKLRGMDCEVIAYDKYKSGFGNEFVTELDLEELRQKTEILSIHIPLDDETRFLFDKNELEEYPELRIILNTARGEVLKLADVVEWLKKEQSVGLGLDVLENEDIERLSGTDKTIFEELISFKNVIITPHVAGWTEESYEKINKVLARKIGSLYAVETH